MLHTPYRTFGAALLAAAAIAGAAAGQVPTRQLSGADAAFPESFSFISGIRELPDGRLLLADPLGQALAVVDMELGVADTIGRVGQGPGEYRQPDGVFPLPGDSTLLVDLGNGRLVALGPDLGFGETTPIAQGEFRPGAGMGGGLNIVLPRGTDARGRVYFQAMGGARPGQIPDSATIMRWDRGTNTFEAVGNVKREDLQQQTSGSANDRRVAMRAIPYSPQDSWAVGADGRISTVRSDGYYVEWIDTDTGARTRGAPVEYRPVRIGRAEKEEYVDRAASAGLAIGMEIQNGVRSMSFSRGGSPGGLDNREIDGYDWPETKPAHVARGVWVTPEGDVWVQRSVRAGSDGEFDVFDAEGQHKERIILPAGRRIVGFGTQHVYVATRDEFDLQWLERYVLGGRW